MSHALLRPFVLRRIDRIDSRVAKHTRQFLCAHLACRTEIRIRIIRIDNLLGVPNQNHRRDRAQEGCVISKDYDRAEHGEQHRENQRGLQSSASFRNFVSHAGLSFPLPAQARMAAYNMTGGGLFRTKFATWIVTRASEDAADATAP